MRKTQIRDDFLHFKTPESCYILGLFHADGFSDQNRIGIKLVATDANDISKTINLCGTWSQHHRIYPKQKWQPTIEYRINSRPLVKELEEKLKIRDKKFQFNLDFLSTISNRQLFLRGLIDGDGCWYYNKKQYLRQFSITAEAYFDWSTLTPLMPKLPYRIKITKEKRTNHSRSALILSDKHSIKFLYEYVYQDNLDIGISRKLKSATDCYDYCCI